MNPNEIDPQHRETRTTVPVPTDQDAAWERAAAPSAVQAAQSRRRLSALDDAAGYRARGVDWVRASDLLARGSGNLSHRAIDFNAYLAARSREAIGTSARRVAQRARNLPPASAFGHGRTAQQAPTRPLAM